MISLGAIRPAATGLADGQSSCVVVLEAASKPAAAPEIAEAPRGRWLCEASPRQAALTSAVARSIISFFMSRLT
ncbi:MAG TPA: hypothetical protein VM468_05160, partial [Mycoplana sp.]|nr:hypothetical protein [Mycoplana sp.]